MKEKKHKYIILAGGLTGGPVKPLIAIAKQWQTLDRRITPVIVDVKNSVSLSIAHDENIKWQRIITGKIRRYFSWKNFFSPLLILFGFVQSIYILVKYRPVIVLGAGGFVQLPLIITAWFFRIPRYIHQQDVLVTLSNQLCAPFANLITTTFEFSIRDFSQGTGLGKKYIKGTKVYWTGTPTSEPNEKLSQADAKKLLDLHDELPVLLVFGGGTGASQLNEIIYEALPQLSKVVQLIHVTGIGKGKVSAKQNYSPLEFADNMHQLYSASDIVLGRAGIGTLSELAQFRKAGIIIPMPDTHQEMNAELLYRTKSAIVLDQDSVTTEVLISTIRKILFNPELEKSLQTNIHALFPKNADEKIVDLIIKTT